MYPLRSKDIFTVESSRPIALSAAFTEIEQTLAPYAESVTQLSPNEIMFRAKFISARDARNPLPTRGRGHLRLNGNDITVGLLQDRYHLWLVPMVGAAVLVAVIWTWLAGVCALGAALVFNAVASSHDRFAVGEMVRAAISRTVTASGPANDDDG
jgi:hypothetical protein